MLSLLFYDAVSGEGEFYSLAQTGNLQLISRHGGWRKTWSQIVPLNFRGNSGKGLLFYDPTDGEIEIYAVSEGGVIEMVNRHTGVSRSWSSIASCSVPAHGECLLLGDLRAGKGEFWSIDHSGGVSILRSHTGWRTTWKQLIAGRFFRSSPGLVFYDGVGVGETYVIDENADIRLMQSYTGWRDSWYQLAGAKFGAGVVTSGPRGLLFYDKRNNQIELYNVQGDGAIRLMRQIANVGKTWTRILTGPMADDPDIEGVLMYNGSMGQASLFRIDEACTLKRIRDYSGWRRGWRSIIWFKPLFRDLSVSTISSLVDTSARKIQFRAIIHNSGDEDVAGPIEVLIGTSIPNWMGAQDHADVPEGVTIAPNQVYETLYTSQYELYDNTKYLIDVLIDPNYLKGDLWRMNNYFHTEYLHSP